MKCPECAHEFEPVEFKEMGARRWKGKSKEEKLEHARRMVDARERRRVSGQGAGKRKRISKRGGRIVGQNARASDDNGE